jgi:hypothetical protein
MKNMQEAFSIDDAFAFDLLHCNCKVPSRQLSKGATSRIHHVLEISYTPRLNNQ